MYKGMQSNQEHIKISIPQRIKTKLKMLATVAAISGLGVACATFSGCDAITKQLEKPVEITSYAQGMQETTQKFDDTYENDEREKDSIPPQEWEQYSNLIEEMQAKGVFDKRHDNPSTEEKYDELLANLNEVLEEKNFSYEAELLVRDTFESICNNYYTWQKGYLDMPSAKDYINNYYIDVIKKLEDINFIDINTDEANEILEKGESDGTMFSGGNGKTVRIISKIKSEDNNRDETIEKFLHELWHCIQKLNLNYLKDYYDDFDDEFMFYKSFVYLFTEGGATQAEQFINEYTTAKPSSWGVMNDDESIEINYTKNNGIGYILPLNAIEKLICLLGYNMYEDIETGNVPITTLEGKMEHYYGKEKGKEFLSIMSEWNSAYDENWKSDKIVDLSINLENLFLELMGTNINYIQSKEQLARYKEIIDHYVERNLPVVLNGRDGIEITEDVFKIKELYDLIAEKEKSFGIQDAAQDLDDDYEIG